jgi:uncharacterized membrane protein YedE/YeeE
VTTLSKTIPTTMAATATTTAATTTTLPTTTEPGVRRFQWATAGLAGLIFGIGLVLSGMTRQDKVVGFLDVGSGAWDPSLAFVMVGAIFTHGLLLRLIARHPRFGRRPLFADRYAPPTSTSIDWRLVVGAAIFGVGWGLGGVCPGPALVSALSLAPTVALFVVGLVAGIGLFETIARRAR